MLVDEPYFANIRQVNTPKLPYVPERIGAWSIDLLVDLSIVTSRLPSVDGVPKKNSSNPTSCPVLAWVSVLVQEGPGREAEVREDPGRAREVDGYRCVVGWVFVGQYSG